MHDSPITDEVFGYRVLFGVYLYTARLPEYHQNSNLLPETRSKIEKVFELFKWTNMKKHVWEILGYHDYVLMANGYPNIANLMHSIHKEVIEQGVLSLPSEDFRLPSIFYMKTVETGNKKVQSKKAKQERKMDRSDPMRDIVKKRLHGDVQEANDNTSDIQKQRNFPLWKQTLRRISANSIRNFIDPVAKKPLHEFSIHRRPYQLT